MIISTIIMITSVRFMTISTRIMTTSNILLIVFVNLPDYRGKCSDHSWRAPDHHRRFVSDETCFRIGRHSHPYRKVRASASDDTRGQRWPLRGYLRSWSRSVRLPLQRRQAAIDGGWSRWRSLCAAQSWWGRGRRSAFPPCSIPPIAAASLPFCPAPW